jgi:hypothetical protein
MMMMTCYVYLCVLCCALNLCNVRIRKRKGESKCDPATGDISIVIVKKIKGKSKLLQLRQRRRQHLSSRPAAIRCVDNVTVCIATCRQTQAILRRFYFWCREKSALVVGVRISRDRNLTVATCNFSLKEK